MLHIIPYPREMLAERVVFTPEDHIHLDWITSHWDWA